MIDEWGDCLLPRHQRPGELVTQPQASATRLTWPHSVLERVLRKANHFQPATAAPLNCAGRLWFCQSIGRSHPPAFIRKVSIDWVPSNSVAMAASESDGHGSDVHVGHDPASDSGSGSDVAEDVEDASDGSESEDSAAAGANGYFDLEASESGNDEDEDGSCHSGFVETSFHQFCRLPIELRHRVWDFFDPYMRTPARVFDINVVERRGSLEAWAAASLEQQTAPARAVLSTHHESRALALRFYPDTAVLSHRAITIPYHKTRDIIRITGPWHLHLHTPWDDDVVRTFANITQLAFEDNYAADHIFGGEIVRLVLESPLVASFPALKATYLCSEAEQFTAHDLHWCFLDSSHHFYMETEEEDIGVGEDLQYMYCWPEITAEVERKPLERSGGEEDIDDADANPLTLHSKDGGKLLRMVLFSFESGLRRFDKMKRAVDSGGIEEYQSSDEESDIDSEENEYESEGIDDSVIEVESGDSDSEDDLLLPQASPNEDESSFGGFSPLEREDPHLSTSAKGATAEFSSLEPESPKGPTVDGSDSDNARPRKAMRGKRRILADSEEESEDTEPEVAAPATGRRPRVVLSDSEDDDDTAPAARGRQRPRVTVQESSDSEGQSATEENQSSNEDSDEISEEDEQPKKLSLAERIGAFRAEIPTGGETSASEAEYDEFNDEGGGEDDNNGGGYGTFQDDEEDNEPSDNDNIMDMTEEASEDDDEEW